MISTYNNNIDRIISESIRKVVKESSPVFYRPSEKLIENLKQMCQHCPTFRGAEADGYDIKLWFDNDAYITVEVEEGGFFVTDFSSGMHPYDKAESVSTINDVAKDIATCVLNINKK